MTEKDIYYLWERACPLSSAYHRLATKEQRAKYEELSEATSFTSMATRFQAHAEETKENPPDEFWKNIHKANVWGPTSERSALTDQLRAQLRTWIRAGEFRVFGFAKPRQPTDKPIEVPTDLWSGFLSWDKSYIEGNGLRIDGLRVMPARWLQKKHTPRQGRPSRQGEIQRAYADLKRRQAIDFNGSLNAASHQVQAHIVSQNPNNPDGIKNIGVKAISLAITDDFQTEKENRKKL